MPLSAEDVLAIQQLMVTYAYLIDMRSAPEAEILSLFTEDALLVSPLRGRSQGRAGQRAFARYEAEAPWGVPGEVQARHLMTNFLIDGDGEQARMLVFLTVYVTELATSPRVTELRFTGHYDCEVRKVDGAWKLASRVLHLDNVSGTPADISERDLFHG